LIHSSVSHHPASRHSWRAELPEVQWLMEVWHEVHGDKSLGGVGERTQRFPGLPQLRSLPRYTVSRSSSRHSSGLKSRQRIFQIQSRLPTNLRRVSRSQGFEATAQEKTVTTLFPFLSAAFTSIRFRIAHSSKNKYQTLLDNL